MYLSPGVSAIGYIASMSSITLVLPIPKTDQNQGHGHWRSASKDRKDDRGCAYLVAKEALGRRRGFPWPSEEVETLVCWYHPSATFRDIWNIVACLKGTIDGCVRAGLLDDDRELQPPRVERETDKENPRVELIFTRKTAHGR